MKKVASYIIILLFTFMMLFGSYNHIAKPEFYNGFIPNIFPKLMINYLSAIIEGIIGLLIIFPKTRLNGIKAFTILMVAFFPIHIWDLLKEIPAIGSKQAAIIRIVVQVIFIILGLVLIKRGKKTSL
jgi:uncharacterized membrane protein